MKPRTVIIWALTITFCAVLFGSCVAALSNMDSETGTRSKIRSSTPPVKAKPTQEKKSPEKKRKENPSSFEDGDYVVGVDIPAGTYETEGATPGLFELCMISTDGDGPGGDGWPQLESANAHERIIITLTKGDGIVSISGCEPLVPR